MQPAHGFFIFLCGTIVSFQLSTSQKLLPPTYLPTATLMPPTAAAPARPPATFIGVKKLIRGLLCQRLVEPSWLGCQMSSFGTWDVAMSHGALVALPLCGAKPKRRMCAVTVSAHRYFISMSAGLASVQTFTTRSLSSEM